MLTLVKFFLIVAILSIKFPLSYARKPAVENVGGISIEGYDDVPPEKAQGFDWSSNDSSVKNSNKNTFVRPTPSISPKTLKKYPKREISSQKLNGTKEKKSSLNINTLIFFILIIFPLSLAYSILFILKQKRSKKKVDLPNIFSLHEKKLEKSDDDDNNGGDDTKPTIPKAS